MRTILHSTERVTANNWETGLFILFLLQFALAASAYVLYHGMQVLPGVACACFGAYSNPRWIVESSLYPRNWLPGTRLR